MMYKPREMFLYNYAVTPVPSLPFTKRHCSYVYPVSLNFVKSFGCVIMQLTKINVFLHTIATYVSI